MNRIKDFFYNKNDIIIVLLILAAAACIIYDRMEVIMDYPQTVAAQTAQQEAEAESQEAANTVTIKIAKKDTLSQVSTKLENAGLIADADEFTDYVVDQKKDGALIAGTYQITKGSTEKEILAAITK